MGISEIRKSGFTRRSFIQGAAATVALGSVAGIGLSACSTEKGASSDSNNATVPKTQIFAGACRGNCAGGCFLNIHVRDGIVVRTTARDFPNKNYNRICSKGLTHVARIYGADRLQYPMKRVGERGEGEFERISWDEAIDTIAGKWKEYTDAYGPNAMAIMFGSGNYAVCSGQGSPTTTTRFRNVTGASLIEANVDAAPGVTRGFSIGSIVGTTGNNEPADLLNSKTIVCWGANPVISQVQSMHFIMEAREKGTKYVVIDPQFNTNASKADKFIPVNSSTDGALAMGALLELFANNWQDEEYMLSYTNAPFLIKEDGKFLLMSDLGVEPTEGDVDPKTGKPKVIDPYAVWDESIGACAPLAEAKTKSFNVPSEINGIKVRTVLQDVKDRIAPYTLEYTSKITGVKTDDITEIARIYAQDGPVNTQSLYGLNHYINGHYNYWPIHVLAACTGNFGKPGAGVGNPELLPVHVLNMTTTVSPKDAAGNACQGAGMSMIVKEISNVIETGSYGGKEITLKGCYITNTNPMTTMAEQKKTAAWMKALEFVVVSDICMTETAKYADILLPAAHWFEQMDMYTCFGTAPYIILQDKAIEPLYECKSDFQIFKLIAEKLGYGEFFDITEEDYIKDTLNTEAAKAMNITWERLQEEHAVNVLTTEDEPYVAYKGSKFLTTTGLFGMYTDSFVPRYNIGQTWDQAMESGLHWEPALEADINSEARKKHPFHLISDHMRTRTHTQWWEVGYLKDYEREPILKICSADADELNIKEGDEVKVSNDRGSVTMVAAINDGLPRGIVTSPRSYQADEFINGHFSSLSTNQFNPVASNQAFNDVAVSIAKA